MAQVEVRKVTNKLLEAVDEGILTWEQIAEAALKYMSEDEVADMAHKNELNYFDDPDEEDEDAMNYFVFGDYGYQTETLLYESTLYSEAKDWINGYGRNGDIGGYSTVEMGYFATDGEWMTEILIQNSEDLYSDLD